MEARPAPLEVGATFADRYRVVGALKHGGMGSVYEVLDTRTDRLRALKVMLPDVAIDADMRARFEREAKVVSRVRSDHIVEVIDAGIAPPDIPFLVMERLHGEDLATLLTRHGKLDPAEVVSMLAQVASGLDKIHEEGVIHRDLKLENLFVTKRDDGRSHIKILDFGVAKAIDYGASLRTTRSLGTPMFMSPEQLTGDAAIGPAADLYALAHAAFCLLAGKPYWFTEAAAAATPYAFITAVARGATEPASERAQRFGARLPRAFDDWFGKATDKEPAGRFGSAAEQIAALKSAFSLPLSSSGPTELRAIAPARSGETERTDAKPKRRPWLALAVIAGALAIGAALVPLVFPRRDAEDGVLAKTTATATSSVAQTHAIAPSTEPPDPRDTSSASADVSAPTVATTERSADPRPARSTSSRPNARSGSSARYDPLDEF
ncbi:MAG: serine/threonine protein kinase [Polyangiaceae bacterium]|nr:serine/threonine protein kinase [Polyangiaceae bacterium]